MTSLFLNSTECPDGFSLLGEKCYKLIEEYKSQQSAVARCADYDAILVEPRSSDEMNAVIDAFYTERIWIGLKYSPEYQLFWLSDSSPLTFDIPWDTRTGNPDRSGDCVYKSTYQKQTKDYNFLRDTQCDEKCKVLCQTGER